MNDDAREAKKAAQKARRDLGKLARGLPRRHGARNGDRAAVFVRWVTQVFGIERLRRCGVVDVAGGSGEIAARLAHCFGIPCVVVDPRTDDVEGTLIKKVKPRLPSKWRTLLENAGDRSERIRSLVTVLREEFPPIDVPDGGLFLGMHADGATEAIVDIALQQKLSFAVVPCCVFGRKNQNLFVPGRRNRAMTYDEFLDHLQTKSGIIKRSDLAFDGRNVVLYSNVLTPQENLGPIDAMTLNAPIVLRNAIDHWPATDLWTCDQKNFDRSAMARCFPDDARGPVHQCGQTDDDCVVEDWHVSEYLGPKWTDAQEKCLYLKDWHFLQAADSSTTTTTTYLGSLPEGFECDWLGPWCRAACNDDFTFCYVGPAGTSTPVHADVVASFSWSANVVGRKLWRLQRPDSRHAFQDDPALLTILQEAGDLVFVPSEWPHDVRNVTECVSINRNWFNALCLDKVAAYLQSRRSAVLHELQQWDSSSSEESFAWSCEKLLGLDAKLNFSNFLSLIHYNLNSESAFVVTTTSSAENDALRRRQEVIIHRVLDEVLDPLLDQGALFLREDNDIFPTEDVEKSWSIAARERARDTLTAIRGRLQN